MNQPDNLTKDIDYLKLEIVIYLKYRNKLFNISQYLVKYFS
jgi:hypothetical protein